MTSRSRRILNLLDKNNDLGVKKTEIPKSTKLLKDAGYLMDSADLRPPDYLRSQETSLFDGSDEIFKNVSVSMLQRALLQDNKTASLNPNTSAVTEQPLLSDIEKPSFGKSFLGTKVEFSTNHQAIQSSLVRNMDKTNENNAGNSSSIIENPGPSTKPGDYNFLRGDLYLSSETDPFATDHDSNDPDFELLNNDSFTVNPKRKKRKKKLHLQKNTLEDEDSSDTDEDKNETTRKKYRKKLVQLQTWRRNLIKSCRNQGKEYLNWKGKKQEARKLKEPCKNCRMKCPENINNEERKRIFEDYWNMGEINRQRDFISKHVTVDKKVRTRRRRKTDNHEEESDEQSGSNQSRRNFTNTYHFQKNGIKIRVCKTFFLNTLSISAQVVKTVICKTGSTGIVSEDRRGKACKNSLVEESVKQTVRDHINSFETIESHYCRKKSSRKYLPPTLNISKMFTFYLEYCQDHNITKTASEVMYRLIFNREFNLSFFQPKKDLCDICHKYDHSSPDEKLAMEEEYRLHLKNKNVAREIKNSDKQKAIENTQEICCAVFDLQQVLPVPKSNVGVSYYKLKLSTYNFTVFNLANKECSCYMWNEVVARRGASEIGSCLLLYIAGEVEKGKKLFLFYSDNCGGQNRNKFLYSMYNYLSQKFKITIRHTYLEKGHTQSEGDSVHSVIERAARNIPIYTPEQWYTIVRTAKRKQPYEVIEVSQENIFDLKELEKNTCINWDKDTNNDKVYISKMKIIETNFENPNTLLFKENYEDTSYKKMNLSEKGRKKITVKISEIKLKPCYKGKLPLTKKKYEHLQFLCQKSAITSQYHDYFKNLPHANTNAIADSDSED